MIFFINGLSIMQRNFEYSLKDVKVLLDLYKSITDTKNTSRHIEYESLKRSSIFLLISNWENYIEDTIRYTFDTLLENVRDPNEIKSTFNSVANSWLNNYKDRKPKPTDLILWTNNDWKSIIRQKLLTDVNKLNTPNTENISFLFRVYFNKNLDSIFYIKNHSIIDTKTRLDKLLKVRGEIAHRVKKEFSLDNRTTVSYNISYKYVKDSVQFIEKLVNAIENNFVKEYKY